MQLITMWNLRPQTHLRPVLNRFTACSSKPISFVCSFTKSFHIEFYLTVGLHREGYSHRPLCAHRYSICLLLPLAIRPKIICRTVHLHISETTPGPSGTQRQTAPGTSHSCQPGPQKRSLGQGSI